MWSFMGSANIKHHYIKQNPLETSIVSRGFACGADETRTRGLLRDRQAL